MIRVINEPSSRGVHVAFVLVYIRLAIAALRLRYIYSRGVNDSCQDSIPPSPHSSPLLITGEYTLPLINLRFDLVRNRYRYIFNRRD